MLKKLILTFAKCLMLFLSTAGQINNPRTWNLSFGGDFSFPENSFKETHGLGTGASVKAEYLFTNHASLTFTTGFNLLKGKVKPFDNPLGKNVLGVPVKVGLRYYLGNFYIGGEGGWVNQSVFRPNNGFVYSFSIGDEIILNKSTKNSLDISFRHEAWITDKSRAFAVLRLAYEFRL